MGTVNNKKTQGNTGEQRNPGKHRNHKENHKKTKGNTGTHRKTQKTIG